MASLFKIDIKKLKGVGPKTALYLNRLGVYTIGDIIRFFPRTYEDWTSVNTLQEAYGQKDKCVKLKILSQSQVLRTRSGKKIYKLEATDGRNIAQIIFYNSKYAAQSLVKDCEYILRGNVEFKFGKYEISSPKIKKSNKKEAFYPVYCQTAGINSKKISSLVKNALELLPESIGETLPAKVINENNLCSFDFALRNIHFPKNRQCLEMARRRIIFEEIFIYQLGIKLIKENSKIKTDVKIKNEYSKEFSEFLPFKLTGAQNNAISECIRDIKGSEFSMNRLLQGDVGSGKTAVAASVAYTVAKNGYQVAIMAPTELLAVQHFKTFKNFFEKTNLKIGLMCGSLKSKERKILNENIENGNIDIVIGTHCLISDTTAFKNLGLIVTDEQHRFGVNQRAKLINKGVAPHVLVMSATPIPRSLALILYGDLDISVLNEILPGRQKIDTFSVDSSKRHRVWNFIKNIVNEGGQCYIVCASIDENENDIIDVNGYYEKMIENGFNKDEVKVLHGKMKPQEKDLIMSDFINGKIKILVSTTVIEVGIDVPKARIIVIENAERFGISQLHQLRGRVGRSSLKSYCVLISDSKSNDSKRRFSAMVSSGDGFYLSEEDLKLRGPGDFFGVNQHGVPNVNIVTSYKDIGIIKSAQEAADISKLDFSDPSFKFINKKIDSIFKRGSDSKSQMII
ncbi:MAG: ATP-dependent DNA helicase RecG [Clostridia bacterium]|nr:ATP-dependent DNA helicase RecG [Clostridia bacterium]